jgi:hypothetical protein
MQFLREESRGVVVNDWGDRYLGKSTIDIFGKRE